MEVLQERNWTRGGHEHVLDGNTLKEEGDRNARALRKRPGGKDQIENRLRFIAH